MFSSAQWKSKKKASEHAESQGILDGAARSRTVPQMRVSKEGSRKSALGPDPSAYDTIKNLCKPRRTQDDLVVPRIQVVHAMLLSGAQH